MVVAPTGMPNYVDIYTARKKSCNRSLAAMVECRRAEVKCEVDDPIGIRSNEILALERQMAADLIVLASPAGRGPAMLLGSVAEARLRVDATCPVLTVQRQESDVHLVAKWMTPHPITAEPAENSRPRGPGCFRQFPHDTGFEQWEGRGCPDADRPRFAIWIFVLAWLISSPALLMGLNGGGASQTGFAICIFWIACGLWFWA